MVRNLFIHLRGNTAEAILEKINIITNKNSTLNDKNPKVPNGLRLGTPAMTTRGMVADDFRHLANIISEALTSRKYDENVSYCHKKF